MGEDRAYAPVEVRAADPGDLDALVAVSLAGARSDLDWAGRDWVPPDAVTARQLWWDRLSDMRSWVAVANAGFTCVGCACAWPAPTARRGKNDLAYLVGPIVDPEWWGEGIGGALLEETLAVLTGRDFARVEMALPAGNRHGRQFLEHRGWHHPGPDPHRSPMELVVYACALTIDQPGRQVAAA